MSGRLTEDEILQFDIENHLPKMEQALRDAIAGDEERPRKHKGNARELAKQVLDMEKALMDRDRYSDKQQEKIDDLMKKVDQYEKFFHAVQLNYQILKDHRAVQELIDRACQWSIASRSYHGDEIKAIDRSAALEMAMRRLQGGV
jgi:non-homologous end joining protein Ku